MRRGTRRFGAVVSCIFVVGCGLPGKTHDLLFLSSSERLVKKLRSDDPELRRETVLDLGERGDPEAAPIVATMLEDKNALVRSGAVTSLVKLRGPDTYSLLVKTLQDRHWIVRWDGADALGKLEDGRAVEPLAQTARRDVNEDVRRAAVKALGQLGEEAALAPLVRALKDANISVAYAASRSLASISGQSLGFAPGQWRQWFEARRSAR